MASVWCKISAEVEGVNFKAAFEGSAFAVVVAFLALLSKLSTRSRSLRVGKTGPRIVDSPRNQAHAGPKNAVNCQADISQKKRQSCQKSSICQNL